MTGPGIGGAERLPHRVDVRWEGGMRYRGGAPGGPTLLLDGEQAAAPSPVAAVAISLAACAAIDVVEILRKRRTPATSLEVGAAYARAGNHPRRITEVRMTFRIATDADRAAVERAIELSFATYCSVSGTLAGTRIDWSLELGPAGEEAPQR